MVSTKQASFHCSASGVEQDKHGCLAPPCGVVRGDHVVSPLWSTSELTVCLHVHRLTSGLKCNTARVMAVTGQEADERVGEECATSSFLRQSGFR